MRKFVGQALGGKFNLGEDADRFRKWLMANEGVRILLTPLLPESRSQRKYYHGAVLKLWAYCDGKDYRDDEVIDKMHDVAKQEFTPDVINVGGKIYKIGKSTKGRENLRLMIDKVIDYLEENYAIDRTLVLKPEDYKYWRDAIFPYGGPDNFIDYLVETKKLYDRDAVGR